MKVSAEITWSYGFYSSNCELDIHNDCGLREEWNKIKLENRDKFKARYKKQQKETRRLSQKLRDVKIEALQEYAELSRIQRAFSKPKSGLTTLVQDQIDKSDDEARHLKSKMTKTAATTYAEARALLKKNGYYLVSICKSSGCEVEIWNKEI